MLSYICYLINSSAWKTPLKASIQHQGTRISAAWIKLFLTGSLWRKKPFLIFIIPDSQHHSIVPALHMYIQFHIYTIYLSPNPTWIEKYNIMLNFYFFYLVFTFMPQNQIFFPKGFDKVELQKQFLGEISSDCAMWML